MNVQKKYSVPIVIFLIFEAALFIFHVGNLETIMFWSFVIGNILYYAVGIGMAFAFQDNRAFCKYVCPITIFLKPASYFSVLRVHRRMSKKIIASLSEYNEDNLDGNHAVTKVLLVHQCTVF